MASQLYLNPDVLPSLHLVGVLEPFRQPWLYWRRPPEPIAPFAQTLLLRSAGRHPSRRTNH